MFRRFGFRSCHQHAPSHAEMHNEFALLILPAREAEHNVLADSLHLLNASTFQGVRNCSGRRFQRFRLAPHPNGFNYVSRNTLIQPVGDGLYFRKFRHAQLLSQASMAMARDLLTMKFRLLIGHFMCYFHRTFHVLITVPKVPLFHFGNQC